MKSFIERENTTSATEMGGWRALVRFPAYRDLAVTGGRQTAERPWELNIQMRMPEMS